MWIGRPIVIVCGDREWDDRWLIHSRLIMFSKDTIIVHGAARGADTIAGEVAEELGLHVFPAPAHWQHTEQCAPNCQDIVGKAAGPVRNRRMLDLQPKLVIAFHDCLPYSRGTKDCIEEARRRGIWVEVYGHGHKG
jgi:hypothetical protein